VSDHDETHGREPFEDPPLPTLSLLSVRMTNEKTDPDVAVLCLHKILTYKLDDLQ
jgi:hypothetical protein